MFNQRGGKRKSAEPQVLERTELGNAAFDLNHRQRYATDEEIEWVRQTTAELPAGSLVIMLGAGPGVLLAAAKDGNPTMHAFVVDIDTCDYLTAHLRHYGPQYADNVFTLVGDSAAVGTRYEGRTADLLIIDADHTERGVFNDIVSWLGHVSPGGLILCHDYDATGTWFADQEQYPGVRVAVDKLFRNYVKLGRVGTSMIVKNEIQWEDDVNIP